MAIFHYTIKIVGRSKGKSVISASAYLNGDVMKNEETGRINQKSNAHKSFVSFIIYTGNISWNPVLSEHSLLDKPIKERAAVFYCRPLVTYKDWVFSLILLLYPMILTTKEILKILIINLSSNLTYDILFSHLPSRKHYCHYCNHYIQHHNSIQNQIRNISSIM